MILWSAYRRYFLNHLPAHFIGFVMGAVFEAVLIVSMITGHDVLRGWL